MRPLCFLLIWYVHQPGYVSPPISCELCLSIADTSIKARTLSQTSGGRRLECARKPK